MHHVMSVITRGYVATSAAPALRDKRQDLTVQSQNIASVLFPTSRDLQLPRYLGSELPICEKSLDACSMLLSPPTEWIRH